MKTSKKFFATLWAALIAVSGVGAAALATKTADDVNGAKAAAVDATVTDEQTTGDQTTTDEQTTGDQTTTDEQTTGDQTTTEEEDHILGDVDGDKEIDTADALLCLKSRVGLTQLTEKQFKAADVIVDNTVDTNDALAILKYTVNLINDFADAQPTDAETTAVETK